MNLLQFRRQIQQKIGLDTTSSGTEETLVDEWINQGVIDVLLRTHVHVNCSTTTLTAGTNNYTLDTDILAVQDIQYTAATDGNSNTLERTTPAEIIRMRTISTDTATRLSYYALNGNDLLMVYPTPTAADTLTMYYVPRPTALSVTSHDPSSETYGGVPTEYHRGIELYALAQGAEFTNDQPSRYGQVYTQMYEQFLVNRVRFGMRRKGGRNLGRAVVGGRRTRPIHDPSMDFSW